MKEVDIIAQAMLEKKAQRVCALNLEKIETAITEHFVICNADSSTQVVAISDYVEEMMFTKCKRKRTRMQGRENAFWVILDYGDIVVHIFQTEHRDFYKLEDLWADSVLKEYKDEDGQ